MFVLGLHPSSTRNGFLDPRWLERRFRFFLANKGEQLIQFSPFHLFGQRRLREFACVGTDPVGHTLWIDLQHSSDRSITTAFHIHADGQQPCFVRITMLAWLGCIDPIAFTTTIALAPRWIEACFVLFPVRSTLWTFHTSYSILFPILGTPRFGTQNGGKTGHFCQFSMP